MWLDQRKATEPDIVMMLMRVGARYRIELVLFFEKDQRKDLRTMINFSLTVVELF